MFRAVTTLGAGLALTACTAVGPDYQEPEISLTSQFYQSTAASNALAASEQWWDMYQDRTMSRLIWHGAADNLSVAAAIERLRAANAGLKRVGLNSQISGDINASAQRRELNDVESDVENASISASFLFDIFGAVTRSQQQAAALAEAEKFGVGAARLAVISEIAESYIRVRFFEEASAITRSTVASRDRLVALVNERLEANAATELEVEQSRTLLLSARASLPPLTAGYEASVFRISTLMASPAEPVMSLMTARRGQPRPNGSTSVGIPADLLRNRPDVQQAERNLAAAVAAVGVAEAALYPSLRLDGLVRAGTDDTWSFGPSLNIPVLNRPVLKANRAVAVANAREAELNWRQSILLAVEEVQEAQSRCRHLARQVEILQATVRSSQRALELSRESYRFGDITLTEVLDAEIRLSNSRLSLASAVRDLSIAWANLNIAAGKGWAIIDPAQVPSLETN